jgi:hypothetical protein
MRKKQHMKSNGLHFYFFFWLLKIQGREIRNPTKKSRGFSVPLIRTKIES